VHATEDPRPHLVRPEQGRRGKETKGGRGRGVCGTTRETSCRGVCCARFTIFINSICCVCIYIVYCCRCPGPVAQSPGSCVVRLPPFFVRSSAILFAIAFRPSRRHALRLQARASQKQVGKGQRATRRAFAFAFVGRAYAATHTVHGGVSTRPTRHNHNQKKKKKKSSVDSLP
jgi:hypothetical protein